MYETPNCESEYEEKKCTGDCLILLNEARIPKCCVYSAHFEEKGYQLEACP